MPEARYFGAAPMNPHSLSTMGGSPVQAMNKCGLKCVRDNLAQIALLVVGLQQG
jgi:hypothetical protein